MPIKCLCVLGIIFLICLLASCTNSSSDAEHDPNVTKNQDAQIDGNRVTDLVAASSFTADVCVANRRVYTAWLDSRDGDRNIYFNVRTEDRGWIHPNDLRLNPTQIGADLDSVRICSSKNGRYIHVVWSDATEGKECVYYSGSNDYGQTFSSPVSLSPGSPFPYPGTMPRICCSIDGQNVFTVWRYGRHDLAFRFSEDAGVSWSATNDLNTFLVNTDAIGLYLVHYPSIDCSDDGKIVHIAWLDYRSPASGRNFYIYHRTWDMVTQNWFNIEQQVSDSRANFPTIKCNSTGQIVHVVWLDLPAGSGDISEGLYHDMSTDYGQTWLAADEKVAFVPGDKNDYGTIACERTTGDICAIWNYESSISTWSVLARAYKDGAWQNENEISIPSHRESRNSYDIPRIVCNGKQIFAIWTDFRDAPQERVYYNRSDNFGTDWISPEGMPLNTPGLQNSYRITNPTIACDASGMFYGIWGEARNMSIPQIYGRMLQDRCGQYDVLNNQRIGDEKIPHSSLVPSHAWHPQIDVSQNNLCGIWLSDRNGFQDVYLSRSTDNGFHWENDFSVNVAPGEIARLPRIICDDNSDIYISWEYPEYKASNNTLRTHVYFAYSAFSGKSKQRSYSHQVVEISSPKPHSLQNIENSFVSQNASISQHKPDSRAQQISSDSFYGGNPKMQADNAGNVYVVYQLGNTWNINPLYMMMSNDRGVSWDGGFIAEWDSNEPPDYILDLSDFMNYDLAFSQDYIYVVAEMRVEADSQVIFYRNTKQIDKTKWTKQVLDTSINPSLSRNPRVLANGTQVFFVWAEYKTNVLAQVYYAYSPDSGTSFPYDPAPIEALPSNLMSAEVAAASSPDVVYAAWTAYHPINKTSQVYFGRMQLEGGTPTVMNSIPLSNISSQASRPTITCDGASVYVAWQDTAYGKSDILGCHSYDGGVTWSEVYLWNTNTPGSSYAIQPALHITPQWVHCVWKDYRYGLNVFYEQRKR